MLPRDAGSVRVHVCVAARDGAALEPSLPLLREEPRFSLFQTTTLAATAMRTLIGADL